MILLDGLDHAERDSSVNDSVLRALPTALPHSVIIVVGTQELKNWEPLALREGRHDHYVPIPLFSQRETESYLIEKNHLAIDHSAVANIYEKSEGLPLYLRYVVTWLRDHNNDISTLSEMPAAVGGDIRDYYEHLWMAFERQNMLNARHLCGVFAALKFSVTEDELGEFQTIFSVAEIPAALQAIAHLLRSQNAGMSVFHDSFRVFVRLKI